MHPPPESRSTRRWQIGFIVGLVCCIVASTLLLGLSTFTAVVSVVALVFAVLNALLGSTDASTEWGLSTLKRLLQVTTFTKVATILVWSTTLAMTAFRTYEWYQHSGLRNVEGLVVNSKSEPLNNVLVNLFRNGEPAGATVTTRGRFRFENVDTRGLQQGQLAVEVQYKDLKKKVPVDLKGQLIITMQQDAPPFRVTYFDVEGPAIDFLLKGELDPAWEQRLGGQPFIVPTDVFKQMQSLVERFADPLAVGGEGGMTLELVSSANKTPRALDEFAERHAGNPVFVGSPESLFFHIEPTYDDISSLISSSNKWRMEVRPDLLRNDSSLFEPTSAPDVIKTRPALFFWRFAEQADIARITGHGHMSSFFKEIVGQSLPPEFAIVELSPLGCGDVWTMDVVARPVKLRVVALENITSSPLRLGRASIVRNGKQGLREFETDQSTLKASQSETMALLPQEYLAPGEKVVIPLAILLSLERSEEYSYIFSHTAPASQRSTFASQLSGIAQVKMPNFRQGGVAVPRPVAFSSNLFAQYLAQANSGSALNKVYVWGTSLMIQDIEVDGFAYPVRQYNPELLALRQGGGIGSCPYVYTRSQRAEPWQKEGHILYGLNSFQKQATDDIGLSRFDGTIDVREEDWEVSYLDQLLVRETSADGKVRILLPDIPALRLQDGQYALLRRGEHLAVNFRGFSEAPGLRHTLVAHGYYLPDWKK